MNKRRKVSLGVMATAMAIGVVLPTQVNAAEQVNKVPTKVEQQLKNSQTNYSPKVTLNSVESMRVQDGSTADKPTTIFVEAGSRDLMNSVLVISDREDGEIANQGQNVTYTWKGDKINYQIPGDYNLNLAVKDKDGNTTSHDINFKVVAPELMPEGYETKLVIGDKDMGSKEQVVGEKPAITLDKDLPKEVEFGAEFDPMKGVTASDKEDGDLTKNITVEGKVDTKVAGDYKLVYNVKDKDGNISAVVRDVTVKKGANSELPEIKPEGQKPVIGKAPVIDGVKEITIAVGQKFDPMKDVKATDEEDGDLTSKIVVDATNIDTSKVGDYFAVYTVEDKDGNLTRVERNVYVKEIKDMGLPGTGNGAVTNNGGLPQTGAVATTAIGGLAMAGGAGAIFFKKRR
ncbi:hypothetical protein UT300012_22600 [Paraclostridium bifermentans]